jgi:hypothetical protein
MLVLLQHLTFMEPKESPQFHKHLPLDSILTQLNLINITVYFFKISFNITAPSPSQKLAMEKKKSFVKLLSGACK